MLNFRTEGSTRQNKKPTMDPTTVMYIALAAGAYLLYSSYMPNYRIMGGTDAFENVNGTRGSYAGEQFDRSYMGHKNFNYDKLYGEFASVTDQLPGGLDRTGRMLRL